MNPLALIKLFFTLAPFINEGIQLAEIAFAGKPDSGAAKLAHAAAHVMGAAAVVLPADQVAQATDIGQLLPVAINAAVKVLNDTGRLDAAPVVGG